MAVKRDNQILRLTGDFARGLICCQAQTARAIKIGQNKTVDVKAKRQRQQPDGKFANSPDSDYKKHRITKYSSKGMTSKIRRRQCFFTGFIALLALQLAAATINLSGKWQFELDPQHQGIRDEWWKKSLNDSITLPGTTSEAGKGHPLAGPISLGTRGTESYTPKRGLSFGRPKDYADQNPMLMHLQQRFAYVGPAWYRRSFDMPAGWTGKDVELFLERVMWESRVWVNGSFVGAQNSLVTPHRYEIAWALKPGRNEIVIRIDNSRRAEIGSPHAYTDEAQTIWNGIIGKIELRSRDQIRIGHIQVRPDLIRKGVTVTYQTHNGSERAALEKFSAAVDGFSPMLSSIMVKAGDAEQTIFYPMGEEAELWSEVNPKLYRLTLTLGEKTTSVTFGMREFKAAGRQFTINGHPVFLRGTVDCCVFPKTGYPDMTGREWQKLFSTAKACGLNHFRFHTWCPPEVAFDTADRLGIYLEPELPDWCFHLGEDSAVTAFFRAEGERMIGEYGNHPSWVMFTMGNELKGDYKVLDDLEKRFRQLDPQLLYASTTYPSSPRGKAPEPADDYYISLETACGRLRGQKILNDTIPNTVSNYDQGSACINVPLLSHEVGQYCVYPNPAEIPKYNGVLRATALEAIRDDLKQKGRLGEAAEYVRDSGKLAALLYKEEIERALRTTNQAGFQLLALNDFPGQGTSMTGLFDSFWDSKGIITPKEFRHFSGPVVPLALMPKRVFQNGETLEADVEIANYGPAPIKNARIIWRLGVGDITRGGGDFVCPEIPLGTSRPMGRIRQTIEVSHAAEWNLSIQVNKFVNDWNVWVYPTAAPPTDTNAIAVFHAADESFYKSLANGNRVLLLPARDAMKSPLAAQFTPVFWNPVMFPNQPGTMGGIIDPDHPLFAEFPTHSWVDWQWWELLNHSFAVDLGDLRARVEMPMRFIDKFNRNALPAAIFEANVGPGRLVVCALDITSDLENRPVARQLHRSIVDYMAGPRFQPRATLSPSDLRPLFAASQ